MIPLIAVAKGLWIIVGRYFVHRENGEWMIESAGEVAKTNQALPKLLVELMTEASDDGVVVRRDSLRAYDDVVSVGVKMYGGCAREFCLGYRVDHAGRRVVTLFWVDVDVAHVVAETLLAWADVLHPLAVGW